MQSIFITGGHKGLGLRAVEHIATKGDRDIVLGGRNRVEMEEIAQRLRRNNDVNVHTIELDVSSMESVRAAAGLLKAKLRDGRVAPLEVLMLNAGAQFLGDIQFSPDGFEKTFATNCLGSFLLLNLLLDDIQRGGRVVFTASGTHDPETMDGKLVGGAVEPDAKALAEQGKHGKPISGGKRYSTSKLCTVLYAYELSRRLDAAGAGITSIAFDPGLIVETGLNRSAPKLAQSIMRSSAAKWLFRTMGVTMGSIPFSGDSLAEVAISPRFAAANGQYIQSNDGRLIEARSSKASYDKTFAARLWADSSRLVSLQAPEEPRALRTVDAASAAAH